eukprot:TRINITY_DN838_c0_g2_i1.p1 TRINITY_DN838_c0_g2~~TRINITY_DN838_c0_g2_i1.p1  ORF type:complete len:2140 (-),score=492.68 TRINITY_DN838_c0_g2_i1:4011-9569(-)
MTPNANIESCVPIASKTTSNFVVLWSYIGADGFGDTGVKAILLSSTVQTTPIVSAVDIHPATSTGNENYGRGAALDNGNYIVFYAKVTGGTRSMYSQILVGSTLAQSGSATSISAPADSIDLYMDLCILPGGDIILAWVQSTSGVGSIRWRRFTSTGTASGSENSFASGNAPAFPNIGPRRSNDFLLSYSSGNTGYVVPFVNGVASSNVITISGAPTVRSYAHEERVFTCYLTAFTFPTPINCRTYLIDSSATFTVNSWPSATAGGQPITIQRSGLADITTSFTVNPVGTPTSATPNIGPAHGGRRITVVASSQIGQPNDITAVTVNGVSVSSIVSQTTSSVTVVTPAGTNGVASITITSTSFGVSTLASGFTYFTAALVSLTPTHGPRAGGSVITLVADNFLGLGSDITTVTVGGVSATIGAQTSSSVTVTTPVSGSAGAKAITITSTSMTDTSLGSFTYNDVGTVTSVTPNNGAYAGGTQVTILASSQIGSGTDITAVQLKGVTVSSIVSQTTSSVTVVSAGTGSAGAGAVTVLSTAYGSADTTGFTYIYHPAGVYSGATPSSSGWQTALRSSCAVTLTASTAFGSGSDITSVSVHGATATIAGQSTSHVVVYAPSTTPGSRTITIVSTSRGVTTGLHDYFVGGPISSVVPSSGPVAGGFQVTITGTNLQDRVFSAIDGDGVTFDATPASSIVSQNNGTVVVVAPSVSAAGGSASISVTSCYGSVTGGFTFNPVGVITAITPNNGRSVGGHTLTVSASSAIGSGSDILSVSVCGISASLGAQTSTSVTITAPNGASNIGLCNVTVTSTSRGIATLVNGYRYHPAGVFSSMTPLSGACGVAGSTSCQPVTITGVGLGSGADITSVTFGGDESTLSSQSADEVVVFPPSKPAGLSVQVSVASLSRGNTLSPSNHYTFEGASITGLSLTNGPVAGDRVVTITTSNTANELRPSLVQFAAASANILSVTATSVAVTLPAGSVGSVSVNVTSCYGVLTWSSNFVYNPAGTLTSVVPNIGTYSGGYSVTISASSQIGDGSDITQVLLNHVAATIVAQTTTSVTVLAGYTIAYAGTNGSVSVESTRWGTATLAQAFTYRALPVISQVRPTLGNIFGGTHVTISGSNLGALDITSVYVADVQATIVSQTNTSVTVICAAANTSSGSVNVSSTTFGLAYKPNAFTYAQLGLITAVIPSQGPQMGSNLVTILGGLGAGDDITSVTFAGVEMSIQEQTSGSVVVIMSAGTPGYADLRVTSVVAGPCVRDSAYFYNIAGIITSVVPRVGPYSGYRITVTGSNLGAGDITTAMYLTTPMTIVSQNSSVVIIDTPPAAGSGGILLSSTSYGPTQSPTSQQITFNPAGIVYSVVPSVVSIASAPLVTIVGLNLGSGSDVFNVTLAGQNTVIVTQLASLLIVRAPVMTRPVRGPIVLSSAAFGVTTATIQFYFRPRILLSASSATLTERGGPVTVDVSLDARPSQPVVVTVSDSTYCSSSIASLAFSQFDWYVTQQISISTGVDFRVTGNRDTGMLLTSNSTDALFHGLTASPSINVIDTDNATLLISRGSFGAAAELALGGYFFVEGETQSLSIQLSSIPQGNVNITFRVNDARVRTPGYVLFTMLNWNVSQNVQLSANSDSLTNAQALTWVTLQWLPNTQDPHFVSAGASTNFLVLDSDLSSSLQLVSSMVIANVSETGTQSAFFIVLTRHITGSATVTAVVDNAAEATLSPASRNVTDSDFLVPLAMVVTGVDDWVQDGAQRVQVTVTMTSTFGVPSSASFYIFTLDNDTAGLVQSAERVTVNETGSVALFSVQMTSQPVANVVWLCSSMNANEVIVLPPATFTRTATNLSRTNAGQCSGCSR